LDLRELTLNDEELLRRQAALQAEAQAVLAALDLFARLGRAGRVELVGSFVSGLMVWRDLDLCVTGPGMTAGRALDAVRPFLLDADISEVLYRQETGARSPTGRAADERFYYVLRYQPAGAAEWKIDLSFWLLDRPRGYQRQLEALARRLTEETRLAILRIKDRWHQQPEYPDRIGGVDVYEAVLEYGVRTPAEFAAYLRKRGLPAGE
jgi:hypothetical protein